MNLVGNLNQRPMKSLYTLLFCLIFQALSAQYSIGLVTPKSPERSVSCKIGFTEVLIQFASPSVRERDIWGELVPYDEVWRAGANYATSMQFSGPVMIDGQLVEAGTYTFFIIPRTEESWTLILNAVEKQWGAFNYDQSQDVLRWEVDPKEGVFSEYLRYDILASSSQTASIQISWASIRLPFELRIPLKPALEARLRDVLETALDNNRWVIYLQAAEILLEEEGELATALEWINESEKYSEIDMEWNEQYYPKEYVQGHMLWTKAKILHALGNSSEALVYAMRMKELSGQAFYTNNREAEQIDELMEQWEEN